MYDLWNIVLLQLFVIIGTKAHCSFESYNDQAITNIATIHKIRTVAVKSLAKCEMLCEDEGYICMGGILTMTPGVGLECTLIIQHISEEELMHDVFSTTFRKRVTNLTKLPGVNIAASSEQAGKREATGATDGIYYSGRTSEWSAETITGWIKVDFPDLVTIEAVRFLPRCNMRDQVKLLEFSFSDSTHQQKPRECRDLKTLGVCNMASLELFVIEKVSTSFAKVSMGLNGNLCPPDGNPQKIGIVEIEFIGNVDNP